MALIPNKDDVNQVFTRQIIMNALDQARRQLSREEANHLFRARQRSGRSIRCGI